MGGIGENEETVVIKGFGEMSKKDLKKLHGKLKAEIQPKLELLRTLAKHLS